MQNSAVKNNRKNKSIAGNVRLTYSHWPFLNLPTLWAPQRSRLYSLDLRKSITVSSFKLIRSFVSVFLLSERLLSTLEFPFGSDKKDLTTFDKSLYFYLFSLEDTNVKTFDQKKSIGHILPVFGLYIQFSSTFSD